MFIEKLWIIEKVVAAAGMSQPLTKKHGHELPYLDPHIHRHTRTHTHSLTHTQTHTHTSITPKIEKKLTAMHRTRR